MNALETILYFLKTGDVFSHENVFFNQTRDESNNRIAKWIQFFKTQKLSQNDAIIIGAILGELTNNSFDHNLGKWQDVSGCMVGFELDVLTNIFCIAIADRGQGIISSLKETVAPVTEPSAILQKAFYERVSGRAPEKRGNGLKFVLKHIVEKNNYLFCITQGQMLKVGNQKTKVQIENEFSKDLSTLIYIEWSIA